MMRRPFEKGSMGDVLKKFLISLSILVWNGSVATAAPHASASANATILKPVSVSTALNLSSGAVKTHGSSPSGAVTVPATYPTSATPAPSYVNIDTVNGVNAAPANAARVNISGAPGQAFTLHFQNWTFVSGQAGSTAAGATYYSPTGVSTTSPSGVLDATGKATVYIGSTITVQRNNPGTTVVLRPVYTVSYD
jgi:hypothetical protein